MTPYSTILRIESLGGSAAITTASDGVERRLGRGKPAALLTYLAAIPGRRASREHLAALLWADAAPDAARQNVRQTLWYLRKRLGDGLVSTSDDQVALICKVEFDRDLFLEAAQRRDLAAAVGTYRGEFLPEFAAPGAAEFELWVDLERRRLVATFLRCADTLAREWLRGGRFRESQALARRARDAAPLDQSGWRLLLEALIAGSDTLGAAGEAEHLEALMLAEELELEPATRASLRTARLAGTHLGAEPIGPMAQGLAPDLIGREREFSRLISAWEGARAGSPSIIVISAPAGIGKSRLLRDLHSRLRSTRSRVAAVRANPGDQLLVGGYLAAVAEAVAQYPGAASVSPGTAAVLVGLSPTLASVFQYALPDGATGEEAVRRRSLALADLLRAVSEEAPLALLLDDLHWADESSARAIISAVSRVEGRGVLTVIAKRTSAAPHGLIAGAEEIHLLPLDLAQIGEFVARLGALPNAPWASELPLQLLSATDGVPLLLIETLQHAIDDGTLRLSENGWAALIPEQLATRWGRGTAIRQRILELNASSRSVLLLLSLAGRPTPTEVFAPEEQASVSTLDARGFVVRREPSLMVAHDEIASTCVSVATSDEKHHAHLRLARALVDGTPSEVSLRLGSVHARESGDHDLLLEFWRRFIAVRRQGGDRRPTSAIAADFIGGTVDVPSLHLLIGAAPWRMRRRYHWIAGTAAAGLLVALSGAFFHRETSRPLATPGLSVLVTSDSGQRLVLSMSMSDAWRANQPLELSAADQSEPSVDSTFAGSLATRSPTGNSWMRTAYAPDSGEQDLYAFTRARGWYRPSPAVGDDGTGSYSPDGRFYAFSTARWDRETGHSNIAILDLRSNAVRRVTQTAESDHSPMWSPDGTRLAFQRRYFTVARALDLCTVNVDGSSVRCGGTSAPDVGEVLGWLNAERVLTRDANSTVVRSVSVSDGASERLGVLPGLPVALVGKFLLCYCRTGQEVNRFLGVVRLGDVADVRPMAWHGQRIGPTAPFTAAISDSSWLEHVHVIVPPSLIPVHGSAQLRVEGRSASGHPLTVGAVRWQSLDSAIAHVDTSGIVHPLRVGTARIIASAGGWRADTVQVRIGTIQSKTVLRENWDSDWTRRWHPFGRPNPRLVATDRGAAWIGGGDGSFSSGAYTRARFDAFRGFGVDATVRLRVTRYQWQNLKLEILITQGESGLAAWNHLDGAGPFDKITKNMCAVAFPSGEGGESARHVILFTTNGSVTAPTPRGLYDGGWHQTRLQVLADGRCALDLDHVRLLTSSSAIQPAGKAMVRLAGDSVAGELEVGTLEVFEGERVTKELTLERPAHEILP